MDNPMAPSDRSMEALLNPQGGEWPRMGPPFEAVVGQLPRSLKDWLLLWRQVGAFRKGDRDVALNFPLLAVAAGAHTAWMHGYDVGYEKANGQPDAGP